MGKSIARTAGVACVAILIAACAAGRQPINLSPEVQDSVERYLAKAQGRFGGFAVSRDGSRAISYFCPSPRPQNCGDVRLDDSFVAIPSGQVAARRAMDRCGSDCVVLYINRMQVRDIVDQQ